MPGIRKYRRDTSEVSCCLKYVIFGVNVLFWFLGLIILAVGVWAWTEKDTFNNLSQLTNIALDPAFILICVGIALWPQYHQMLSDDVAQDGRYAKLSGGTITFIIGFTGCVGALRENTCLLACYAVFLALLLLAEMTTGILFFVFKDWIKLQAATGFQTFITHYREDPDQQNLIDWIQEDWLQCCGVEGPRDWDRNAYFNCSSGAVGSREACGVPFSCCRSKPQDIIRNKQCGYDVRKPTYNFDIAKIIYDKGCLEAAEEWFDHNLLIVATSAVCTAFAQLLADVQRGVLSDITFTLIFIHLIIAMRHQNPFDIRLELTVRQFGNVLWDLILGICFAQNLRADIFAQKAKWH